MLTRICAPCLQTDTRILVKKHKMHEKFASQSAEAIETFSEEVVVPFPVLLVSAFLYYPLIHFLA
jgi:hypothetical protein